jgi:RNA polymerase sigma-70 factor (ECF subfamily)
MTQLDDIWRQHRPYLIDVAFGMLGNIHDAEDVVQEGFSRLLSADIDEIQDLRGWLVVVVSRLCLDQLRSARSRRDISSSPLDSGGALQLTPVDVDPADRVTLDDSVRLALLVVLEQLTPPERAVFVLHDVFKFSFDAIAGIVGRTPAACRQLASRARHRIESETEPARFQPSTEEQRRVAQQFIEACAGGDLDALMRILDPDVSGDADLGPFGGPGGRPRSGSRVVGRGLLGFFGPATGVTLVSQLINGQPGVLGFRDQELVAMVIFKLRDGLIADIHAIADPQKLAFAASQMPAPN